MTRLFRKSVLLFCVLVFGAAATPGSAQTTSEENPPLICPTDQFVAGITCTGRYCDNVGIVCRPASGATWGAGTRFMPFVSEEAGGRRDCDRGMAVAGLSCRGRFCDDISLLCVQTQGAQFLGCETSASVSEEGGGRLELDPSRIATGIICTGSYCDNKQLIGCRR